ncbi:MAG: phosphate signaling complex protein PhoU [Spirochaetales bacterium]|nr:phosphate signaling complex protein PhoU [Spirochaetales bacterium]
MTTRQHYHEKLEQLKIEVLKMAGIVNESISRSMHALIKRDASLAQKVVDDEKNINQMEFDIEEQCVVLIATEQPVAGELRFIISTLKTVRDLERCGDYACHVATTALNFDENATVSVHEDLPKMAVICRDMLKNAMDAYNEENAELAAQVRKKDDIVDSLYLHSFKELLTDMKQEPEHVKQVHSLLFVGKCLERLGDHIINICEEVEYIATGKRIE